VGPGLDFLSPRMGDVHDETPRETRSQAPSTPPPQEHREPERARRRYDPDWPPPEHLLTNCLRTLLRRFQVLPHPHPHAGGVCLCTHDHPPEGVPVPRETPRWDPTPPPRWDPDGTQVTGNEWVRNAGTTLPAQSTHRSTPPPAGPLSRVPPQVAPLRSAPLPVGLPVRLPRLRCPPGGRGAAPWGSGGLHRWPGPVRDRRLRRSLGPWLGLLGPGAVGELGGGLALEGGGMVGVDVQACPWRGDRWAARVRVAGGRGRSPGWPGRPLGVG